MNFFIYKTTMGLIFSFVKKDTPPNDFCAPHFLVFGHFLPTVSYCSKLCTRISLWRRCSLSFDSLKEKLFKTDNQGQICKQFGVRVSKIAL